MVRNGTWWNGGYNSWHRPFAASDVPDPAPEMIARTMNIEMVFFDYLHRPMDPIDNTLPNGYAHSFAELGVRAYYYTGGSKRMEHARKMYELKPKGDKDTPIEGLPHTIPREAPPQS